MLGVTIWPGWSILGPPGQGRAGQGRAGHSAELRTASEQVLIACPGQQSRMRVRHHDLVRESTQAFVFRVGRQCQHALWKAPRLFGLVV